MQEEEARNYIEYVDEDEAERIELLIKLVELVNHDIRKHAKLSAEFEVSGYFASLQFAPDFVIMSLPIDIVQIPMHYGMDEHEVSDGFYHSIVYSWRRDQQWICKIKGRRQGFHL